MGYYNVLLNYVYSCHYAVNFIVYYICKMNGASLVKIATFTYSAEAYIVKARLQAEGVTVYIIDSYTVETHPLLSNAVGGVKLFVPINHGLKAQKLYNDIKLYSIDEEGKAIRCPYCNTQKNQIFSTIKDIKSCASYFIAVLLFLTMPFYIKYKYHCRNCHKEFDII